MALYKDGNPVSGLNSIPRLTLAQYNTLNVKPEFWVRTDAPESYKKLSADQVSYDSNNTVKDKIDDLTTAEVLVKNATGTTDNYGTIAFATLFGSGSDENRLNVIFALAYISTKAVYTEIKTYENDQGVRATYIRLKDDNGNIHANKTANFKIYYTRATE